MSRQKNSGPSLDTYNGGPLTVGGGDAVWAIQATTTASPGGVEAGGGGWTEAGGGTG